MSTAVQPALQSGDSLGSLEQRIQQAVQLVARLRAEKESALAEAATARTEAAEAKTETARLSEGVQSLQAERKQVRQRIEKLLDQIDQLSAS
jgi:FtsZ-binding cell division protein ZapB